MKFDVMRENRKFGTIAIDDRNFHAHAEGITFPLNNRRDYYSFMKFGYETEWGEPIMEDYFIILDGILGYMMGKYEEIVPRHVDMIKPFISKEIVPLKELNSSGLRRGVQVDLTPDKHVLILEVSQGGARRYLVTPSKSEHVVLVDTNWDLVSLFEIRKHRYL